MGGGKAEATESEGEESGGDGVTDENQHNAQPEGKYTKRTDMNMHAFIHALTTALLQSQPRTIHQ